MSTDHEMTCPTCGQTLDDEHEGRVSSSTTGDAERASERQRSYAEGRILKVIPRPRGMKMRA